MRQAHVLMAVLLVGVCVSPGLGNVTDTFWIDLDQSQISPWGGYDFWGVENLPTNDELVFAGETYTAHLRFLNDELLDVEGLDFIHYLARSISGLQYFVDFTFTVSGPGGSLAWGGNAGSDMSGIVGGTYGLIPGGHSIMIDAIDLELLVTSNAAAFTSLDVGLAADSIAVVPEPTSLALLVAGVLALRRRR